MSEGRVCKSCGKAYEFFPTTTGKTIPLDVEPTAKGNIIIDDGVAVVLKKGDPRWFSLPADERRQSHFATCPYARDYRKRHPMEQS